MSEMDGVLITFFISMVVSAVVYLLLDRNRRNRIKKPIESPPETPISISI